MNVGVLWVKKADWLRIPVFLMVGHDCTCVRQGTPPHSIASRATALQRVAHLLHPPPAGQLGGQHASSQEVVTRVRHGVDRDDEKLN